MWMSKERLINFLNKNNLFEKNVRLHDFNVSTHTAVEAAGILGVTIGQIIKSIVIIMGDKPYLVIISGDRKMKQRALRKVIAKYHNNNASDSRLANSDEVLKFTSYPVGGVPPLGLNIPIIIDKPIKEKKVVYAGGGTTNTVLELPVEILLEFTNHIIADIGKDVETSDNN